MITITPIGHVHGGRATNDDDDWGRVRSVIRLDPAHWQKKIAEEGLLV